MTFAYLFSRCGFFFLSLPWYFPASFGSDSFLFELKNMYSHNDLFSCYFIFNVMNDASTSMISRDDNHHLCNATSQFAPNSHCIESHRSVFGTLLLFFLGCSGRALGAGQAFSAQS